MQREGETQEGQGGKRELGGMEGRKPLVKNFHPNKTLYLLMWRETFMFYCGFRFLPFMSRQICKSPCIAYSFVLPLKYLELVPYPIYDGMAKLLITKPYLPIAYRS